MEDYLLKNYHMGERLKQFMLYKQLLGGELAEKLGGIAISNIRHILAGRNTPSVEFIQKLLNAFPDLDGRWFITGEGSMINNRADEK